MKTFTNEFFLTAAEVNAQEELPLSRLVTLIIDTATGHANRIGVGYADMMKSNSSWVLSRLSVDIARMPGVNHDYRLVTWVHSVNKLFSERQFRLEDDESGEILAWVDTIWMAIDMDSRRPTDLLSHNGLVDIAEPREFLGSKCGKLQPLSVCGSSYPYTFKVSDIDVNRHVTTRRYIDLITDLWPLERYEACRVSRFEIAFKHEARYGEEAFTCCLPDAVLMDEMTFDAEIRVDDTACALARVNFRPRG